MQFPLAYTYPISSLIWTFLLFTLFLSAVGAIIWAAVDAIRQPADAFRAAGSSKALWLVLVIVPSVLIPFVGVGLAVVYLTAIRPRVNSMSVAIGAWTTAGPAGTYRADRGSDEGLPPAGWYPDPQYPSGTRWWNGSTWADAGAGNESSLPPVSE